MKRCLFSVLALVVVLLSSFTAPSNFIDLSKSGTANCYIVSKSGYYKFHAVKGNSTVSVGSVSSVAVLWESYGTYVKPSVGALIKKVAFNKGYIAFQTADTFKEGNAVIAAKDANGKILWSWHIWFTDQPKEQVYYNDAGTMMDRNLGATSATPGDVGARGLLYQWGRKDPFLGSSSISGDVEAKSTITWPSEVKSTSSTGTISYATAHPTTFITYNGSNWDWYYTGSSSTDNTRWTTSESSKSIYDPCPAGWRVPDGGDNGVWLKALGSSSSFDDELLYSNKCMNFSGKFGSDQTIWYPASGYRYDNDGGLYDVGYNGAYWSASPSSLSAYVLFFNDSGFVNPSCDDSRARGQSVRCLKEELLSSAPQEYPHQSDLNISSATDLSSSASANCYIISEAGLYKFKTVKGNSSTSVGSVASASILWETFGTSTSPEFCDLISGFCYKDGYIAFQTADTFKEGNAVIAAKDANGNILWSWHIWFTDQPKEQVYYNNAGIMMDRNLGATSATPGEVGALGLLYQWGRKDPFLGSSSISGNTMAKSTITWPSTVVSDSSTGTIAYATANPTTFIEYNSNNYDWYYTGSSSTDNTRWTPSDKAKSIYDPCPAGWRVPDGGSNDVWSKALGSLSGFNYTYDSINEGMNFSGKFGSDQTIWYPASGFRSSHDGRLYFVGNNGYYWSASPDSYYAYSLLDFSYNGSVDLSSSLHRAGGPSVRCVKEDSLSPAPHQHTHQSDLNISSATDLSSSGSANCYIVSKSGTYKFKTVKGNSSTPVGSVCVAETLWETFGTSTTPSIGDLVSAITYKDGYVAFQTANTFKEGNAVIAAKDANGKILWSWHIWFTDQPKEQVYYNNAGTMMDRNLGATSATPGDVGALGLLYQWGRKDPFLGSSSISEDVVAKSTITWPSAVVSDSSTGTIAYATANPTTFIKNNSKNYDWYYTGSSSTDNTRWTTSESSKSIYDPCPSGWRVPDGGANGVWSKALGSSSSFTNSSLYSSSSEGMNFSGKFGSDQTIWYPASGYRYGHVGSLYGVGDYGYYWSASPRNRKFAACRLFFYYDGNVYPSNYGSRALGYSVRCLQESK